MTEQKNEENTITKESQKEIRFPVSLRDWFSGMALQGYLANPTQWPSEKELIAEWCYKMADTMMEARDND